MKKTIAIATKEYSFKKVELKTWEKIMEYQRKGWKITLVK